MKDVLITESERNTKIVTHTADSVKGMDTGVGTTTTMKKSPNDDTKETRQALFAPRFDRLDSELNSIEFQNLYCKPGNTPLQFKDVPIISNCQNSSSTETRVVTDLHQTSKAPLHEESCANVRDKSSAGPRCAIVRCDIQGSELVTEQKISGVGNYRQQSPPKVMIRPEMCNIGAAAIAEVNPEKMLHGEEPKKTTALLNPKPEKEDDRIRKSVSRQSTNISSIVEVIDDDDDIDLEVAKQYYDTFNELLQRYPQFMTDDPSLMEIIRVAKLQKILSATLEMERELEEYVQSLTDQKNEVSAHYQKKLLEASRRNAEREYFLKEELDTLKALVSSQENNNRWSVLSMYKDYFAQCQQVQKDLISRRLITGDDPISILPECLASEKQLLLDALRSAYDGDRFGNATIDSVDSVQIENVALIQEVNELEKELSRLKLSSEAKRNLWVDSVVCSMDFRQFEYMKESESNNNNM